RKRVAPKPDERHVALAAHGLVDRLDAPGALVKFFGDRRGYAWVFNRRDRSSVGVGVPMMRRDDWRRLWSTFFAEQAPGREAPPVVSWPLPLATDESAFAAPMAGDDWCLVGDAAGHVDPLTGEGIYYAMWGGQIAAACVARGKPAEYDTQWREAFLSTFLRHAATARHLEHRWRVELLVAGASLPFLNRKIYASMTSG
ncbi:hypothetical protein K8I61_07425, partial [bacterium]|nr:hypothetical protein [bacterium]